MGSTILRTILNVGWGPKAASVADQGVPTVERTVQLTRADIIVDLGTTALVVENKVDAREHALQCEKLYEEWGPRALFLFLSKHGGPPETAISSSARRAWRSLSYGSLARLLAEHVDRASPTGRVAIQAYLETLGRPAFPPRDAFTIGRPEEAIPYASPQLEPGLRIDGPDAFTAPGVRAALEHRQEFREVFGLEKRLKEAHAAAVRDLLGPVGDLLVARVGAVESGLLTWDGYTARHPMFWRPAWTAEDGTPLAGVGLAWEKRDPTRSHYSGLFVRASLAPQLRERLKEEMRERVDWCPGHYPVAFRYVVTPERWWTDLPTWRGLLAESVIDAWDKLASLVDHRLHD